MAGLHDIVGVESLAARYPVWLCDIWGVVHNGEEAFDTAVDALVRYRQSGGAVALITNAPRPSRDVTYQLDNFGVPSDAYDTIVSSGDVTRNILLEHGDASIFHLGPERDAPIYAGLELAFVDIDDSNYILCTGLFDDETEQPEDYHSLLELPADHNITMLCANPDRVVQRGDRLIYCAGALADVYQQLGGDVIYAGKPYPPIYQLALERLSEFFGTTPDKAEILVIGDGLQTDLSGAARQGYDALFITGGIHTKEMNDDTANADGEPGFLERLKSDLPDLKLIAVQERLVW